MLNNFFAYIEHSKAYNTVPREILWIALQKLGKPEVLANLVRFFRSGIKNRVRMYGALLYDFDVSSDL